MSQTKEKQKSIERIDAETKEKALENISKIFETAPPKTRVGVLIDTDGFTVYVIPPTNF